METLRWASLCSEHHAPLSGKTRAYESELWFVFLASSGWSSFLSITSLSKMAALLQGTHSGETWD